MRLFKQHWGIFLVLFLSTFSILPFFHSGFFSMHDDTQVGRVFEMGKALSDGMFPVRWVQDLGYGYGYPIFNFYSPLPYYIGGVFNLIGFDALSATKMVFFIGILISGIIMYVFLKNFVGQFSALIGAVAYLYFPYHAINIYVRGAMGEFFAYAFLPLVFLGLFKLHSIHEKNKDLIHNLVWILLTGVSTAVVILSHNLSAYMLALFVILFITISLAVNRDRTRVFLYYVLSFLLAFLLSAFYSIPAVFEMGYTNVESQVGGGADYKDHFVCIPQLWESMWGFGGSISGCLDGMSFRLGKVHILSLFASSALFLFIRKKINRELQFIYLVSIAFLLVSLFMTTEYSGFAWDNVPQMAFLQYPWRFLNFSGFFLSVIIALGAFFIGKIKNNFFIPTSIIMVVFLLLYNAKFFQPQTHFDRSQDFYTNDTYLKWNTSKISDEYMPQEFYKLDSFEQIPVSKVELSDGHGKIENIIDKTGFIKAQVSIENSELLKVNIAPFPAWKAFVDGQETKYITKNLTGVIDGIYIEVPIGTHDLELRFVQTPIEKLANMLSIFGVAATLFGIMKYSKYRYGKKITS